MNLVLEIVNAPNHSIFESAMTFNQNGGKIGRNKQMDWVLHDPTKYISNFHAEISFGNNQYYITDKSSNGTAFKNPQKKLTKDIAVPLSENTIIVIGKYEISVKLSSNMFLNQDPATVHRGGSNDFDIPDQFFTGNETEKAFDIISNNEKSSDILSLIDNDAAPLHNEILPDLDNIIGNFDEQDNPSVGVGMNVHMEMPEITEVKENIASSISESSRPNDSYKEDKYFDLLIKKLGIDVSNMNEQEKEIFINEIANIVQVTVAYAQTTAQSVKTIKSQLGVEGSKHTNLLTQGISSEKILGNLHKMKIPVSKEIQALFHEVNTHNVALYSAISNVSLEMMKQFSPQKLYFSFEQDNLLSKKLSNKKALAWDAYVQRYRYLDTLTHKEDVDKEILKKEYISVLNTLNLGHIS